MGRQDINSHPCARTQCIVNFDSSSDDAIEYLIEAQSVINDDCSQNIRADASESASSCSSNQRWCLAHEAGNYPNKAIACENPNLENT